MAGVVELPSLDDDAAARRAALEPDSFIVEAPAGAGKTELLTQRFLALLAGVESPEEIVAITFTRKAAAEMRGRIVRNLAQADRGDSGLSPHHALTRRLARAALERGAARGWDLRAQPGRLRIMTIDAFCALLARQAPLVSRIGGNARVGDDPEALYAAAAQRTLAQLEGGDEEHAASVAAALAHLDNDVLRLKRLLAAMLARRDQWLSHGRPLDPARSNAAAFRLLVEAALAPLAAAIDDEAQRALLPIAAQATASAPDALAGLAGWDRPLGADWGDLARWQALAGWLLTRDGSFRKRLTVNEGFPPGPGGQVAKAALADWIAALPAAAEAALGGVLSLPGSGDEAGDEALIAALSRLLWLAVAELWLVFAERREVDFTAVAEGALRALGERETPSDLALDHRIAHLLVDEFQDTSPGQVELLARLTAGWSAGDGRTLFCVGDPMQSIYRFRKAEVGLFIEAGRRGIGELRLRSLRLARNNRSDRALIDWVNDSLAPAFAADDEPRRGAIAYRPFVATREDREGSGAFWHPLVCAAGVDASAAARAEARQLVALVEQLRAADPGRDVAVLVRARSHLATLVTTLRRERPGLLFEAVEIDSLASRQWVQDLLILTRALLQRADRVNALALLRSPLCGLRLADLHALAAGSGDTPLSELMHDPTRLAALSGDGRARLLALREVLADAWSHAGRQPLPRWIEGVWLALGGPATLPDAAAHADCRALFALFERLAAARRFALDALDAEVGRLFAAADPRGVGRLTLMTLHKAKGLEFDTVILPGLHRQPRASDEKPLLRWEPVRDDAGESHTAIAALPAAGSVDSAGAAYRLLERLERERTRAEAARLFYVGATRARRALHLFASVWRAADGESLRAPPSESLLAFLWPQLAERWGARAVDLDASGSTDEAARFVPPLCRLGATAASARLTVAARAGMPGIAAASAAGSGGGAEPAAAAGAWRRERHRREAAIGTLAHRYLEFIARDGLAAWPAARIAGLRPAMSGWLAQTGLGADDAGAAAGEVVAMLQATIDSADGRRVLGAAGAAELALVSDEADGVRLHVIDRLFDDDAGSWVVDYKTEIVASTDAAGFAAAARRHAEQLDRYADLLGGEGRAPRRAVLFVRYGRLVELDVPGGT